MKCKWEASCKCLTWSPSISYIASFQLPNHLHAYLLRIFSQVFSQVYLCYFCKKLWPNLQDLAKYKTPGNFLTHKILFYSSKLKISTSLQGKSTFSAQCQKIGKLKRKQCFSHLVLNRCIILWTVSTERFPLKKEIWSGSCLDGESGAAFTPSLLWPLLLGAMRDASEDFLSLQLSAHLSETKN